jgi:hypothetical protein
MHGGDEYEFFSEGEHTIYCDGCGEKFEFQTYVSVSFQSPALIAEDEAEEVEN